MDHDLPTDLERSAAPRRALWTLRVAMLGLTVLVVWAALARIDQVTRAQAQIIAAARTQVVQSADGGVVTALHVREGDTVLAGQLLVTLGRARAQAAVDDTEAKMAALRITLTRLQAEVYGTQLKFAPDLLPWSDYIRNQTALFQKRRTAIDQEVAALQRMLVLAQAELRMVQQLESSGDVSRSEVLRLQRAVADLEAQITNKRNRYFQDAQAEMTRAQEELNTQSEQMRDRSQLLAQTELHAPADGIINNVRLPTVGGVVRPGETVMEILPTGGDLVAEARISPADIAFVQVGQSASVKLDAYDFSIFGAMNGEVSYISPDTLTEETAQGRSSYYRVHIRIREAEFKGQAQGIQVRPGMTASVDIKAMERSVLSYLTKPITKTLAQSFGER